MSMSFKASPDGTFGEILVNGQVVAKLPVTGNAVIPGLVGTVSHSGGIPTGAVVERGSNANGEYVRFADGTQICVGSITSSTTWNATGLGFRYSNPASAAFPATFAVAPTVSLQPSDGKVGVRSAWVPLVSANTTQVTDLYLASTSGSTQTDAQTMRYTATGRWF